MFSPPRAFSGRVSSIIVSGTSIVRPIGHLFQPGSTTKTFVAPTDELDVEVELGFFVGRPSQHFKRVSIAEAEEYIFGVVMVNDWSSKHAISITTSCILLYC